MKSSSLTLSEPLTSQLGHCEIGDEKEITITVKVTGVTGGLSGKVISVEPYVEEEEEADEKEAPPKKKRPPAVTKAIENSY